MRYEMEPRGLPGNARAVLFVVAVGIGLVAALAFLLRARDWPVRRIVAEGRIRCMVWDGREPEGARHVEMTALGPGDVAQILTLVELTRPGPFGPSVR